ncbi:hypothetical protein E8E14_014341 [Neopestalotiopsis sp. 37M]|nr:hypothetical protein E8E14_014341 [Neopestalotiopsis sp. 37M]
MQSLKHSFSISLEDYGATWLAIFSIIAAIVGILIIQTATQWYRLSHVPGPLAASLTNFWAFRASFGGHYHVVVRDLQQKYGKIVRIAPNDVLIADPDALWKINSARSVWPRGDWYAGSRLNPDGDTVLSELDTVAHDKRKAKLISGFSGKGLMDIESNVDQQLSILVGVLKRKVDNSRDGAVVLDLGRLLQHFQVDLITLAGTGEAWGNLLTEEDHYNYLEVGDGLLNYTIRGTLLYLMTAPRVYNKLKKEIAEGVQNGRISTPIKGDEAKNLPYLKAVIHEGLRISTPGTAGFPKRVPPGGGELICGKMLPAATDVHINLVGLMRSREVFGDDVDVFRPERFLDVDDETAARRRKVVDLNFGHGRWLCLGKALALLELNKIFVELLRAFDFQIADPEKPWKRESAATYFVKDFVARVTYDPIA